VTILPDHAHPLVRAAVTALDSFGAVSAREATILIGYWARRDQLTPADVDAILSHYGDRPADPSPAPVPAPGPSPADDPLGMGYQPAPDELDLRLVPPYVEGYPASGWHHTEGGTR
jgi:hypothetical protein